MELQLDWLDEPGLKITPGSRTFDNVSVAVDPRLSLNQVAHACRQLGDLGWQILGTWCSIMRPSMGPGQYGNGAPTALGIVTPDHIIRWISPQIEVMLGWPSEALVGSSVMALASPDQVRHEARDNVCLDGMGTTHGRLLARTSDGRYRTITSSANTMCFPTGEPAFVLNEWRLAEDATNFLRADTPPRHWIGDNAA